MPVILEPGDVNCVTLDTDAKKDAPPSFLVKSLSMRETRNLTKAYDNIWATATDETNGDMFERLFGLLSTLVVGWVNFNDEWDADKLWDVLTFTEARELAVKILNGQYTSYEQKKS